jgi:hypothetical protein
MLNEATSKSPKKPTSHGKLKITVFSMDMLNFLAHPSRLHPSTYNAA